MPGRRVTRLASTARVATMAARAAALAALATVMTASCSNDEQAQPVCTPATPPPPAPASVELTLARAVADRYIAEHPVDTLAWDWPDGVLLTGMGDLQRATGAAAYGDYTRQFLDRNVDAYRVLTSDRSAPAAAAATTYPSTCDPRYRTAVEGVLTFLYDEALRTPDGGISHFGAQDIFGATLWVDSLFMFGMVLVRWGEAAHDARALDEYSKQYRVFASHLQDTSGLFVHAYEGPFKQDPNVYWGRGNGWALASGFEYLRVRKSRGENDDAVAASLQKLAAAIVPLQDPTTGLFWTIVNRPGETYLETSATALFAFGLARGLRLGVLDASVRPVIDRAIAGIKSRLVNDASGRPVVTGISGPTNVGPFRDYAQVPLKDDLAFGVGAVLMALVETSGL